VSAGVLDHPPVLLSREKLAELSGFTTADLDQLEAARLICAEPAGGYRGLELVKLDLVRQVAEHSEGLEHLIRRYREGGYTLGFLNLCMPEGTDVVDMTYDQAMEQVGVSREEFEAVLKAAGLPMPGGDQLVRTSEYEALQAFAMIRALPIPVEARLHAVRATAEGLRRAAEVQAELFQTHVVDPILDAHREDFEAADNLVAELSATAHPLVTSITNYLYQRYMEHEITKHVTERMEEAARTGYLTVDRQRDPSVLFVDLAGYTTLTADAGDVEAAQLAGRFTDELVDAARVHNGRIIKTLGDGAMLFFDNPLSAVRAGLRLVRVLPAAGLPPARVGINRGPVVAQSGDYFGTTINVAARINDYARPHEVLLASAVLPDGGDGIGLEEIGEVSLKGVPRPIHLFRARDAV
jgi:adenylate cyclase